MKKRGDRKLRKEKGRVKKNEIGRKKWCLLCFEPGPGLTEIELRKKKRGKKKSGSPWN